MEKIKEEIIKILNIKDEEITEIRRFSHGMSNYTYKVKLKDKSYVYRKTDLRGSIFTNYPNELNALSVAINSNLTSDLIYFDIETGNKLSSYIIGRTVNLKNLDEFEATINTLKKLHSIKNAQIVYYDLSGRIKLYESFLDTKILCSNYFLIKDYILKIYDKYYKNTPKVFCHNDLQESNIIYNEETLETKLIDFEFAALNDLYYDLASIEYEPALVYQMYFGKEITSTEENHILFYKMYQTIQWYLVATYKDINSFLLDSKYNFKDLSTYFITESYKIYEKISKELLL